MALSVLTILALIFLTCNASSNPREQPMTRTSGATWLQSPQNGRSTDQRDIQDVVINVKDLLNELQLLGWVDLELKKHLWLRYVTAKPQPFGPKFSSHGRDYSKSEMRTQKLEKRLLSRYHRQFLSRAMESIKNGQIKPARFNFDLGKRSDTEDQIDQVDNVVRRYRENKTGRKNGLGLSQLYMNYVNQQFGSGNE